MGGYTKEAQLRDNRKKKKSTFGKPKPRKQKRNDIIDDDYTAWLSAQPCVITGKTAERGAGQYNIHIHHIDGRGRGTNDYETVPLMGYIHSWGLGSYHSSAPSDFKKKHLPNLKGSVKNFFRGEAERLRQKYMSEGGVIFDKVQ